MLTHNNAASNVGAVNQLTTMYPNDVHISYLPLAHIYECVTTINLIVVGAAIGFWHGVRDLRKYVSCSYLI
jgi:long-chain acyl-CoA synthetase